MLKTEARRKWVLRLKHALPERLNTPQGPVSLGGAVLLQEHTGSGSAPRWGQRSAPRPPRGPSGTSEGQGQAGSRRSKAARRTLRSQARPSRREQPQQPQPSPCPVTSVSAADSGPAPRAASGSRPSRADPQRLIRSEDPAGPAPLTEPPASLAP